MIRNAVLPLLEKGIKSRKLILYLENEFSAKLYDKSIRIINKFIKFLLIFEK